MQLHVKYDLQFITVYTFYFFPHSPVRVQRITCLGGRVEVMFYAEPARRAHGKPATPVARAEQAITEYLMNSVHGKAVYRYKRQVLQTPEWE